MNETSDDKRCPVSTDVQTAHPWRYVARNARHSMDHLPGGNVVEYDRRRIDGARDLVAGNEPYPWCKRVVADDGPDLFDLVAALSQDHGVDD
jgi:hypothetical protein